MGPAVFSIAVAVIVLFFVAVSIRQQRAFEERFPPISDEEFVARCRPGTTPDVALRVRRIVARRLCVEYDRVHPSGRFMEDFGAD